MRILLVEDEADLAAGIAHALQRQSYAVDCAADGEEALIKAVTIDYDLIILDVMLPVRDGWSVLAELRANKATPVLMLTACDRPTDRVRGLDTGADDYLVKPFDVPELLARTRALLRRSVQQPRALITLGTVILDLNAHKVTRQGTDVVLTAREYSILEYLALHRGQLVTRTLLYEHVCDETDDSSSNLIDVHVSNLRRKLGHDLITTRRGLGYSIE